MIIFTLHLRALSEQLQAVQPAAAEHVICVATHNIVWHSQLALLMQVTIKGCTGPVNTFVVEPFVPHKEEYYLCIQSNRLDIDVSFSTAGGVEIEENWDKVKTISIPTATAITGKPLHAYYAVVCIIGRGWCLCWQDLQ